MDMMELTIRGMLFTVPVTSRRAYIFLSAGSRSAVCPAMTMPTFSTFSMNRSWPMLILKPGKLSSLSRVPPVWPRPRPDILAIFTPRLATMGTSTRLVLSPTPPVECLSAFTPEMPLRSRVSPECIMAMVSSRVSSRSIPRKNTAMRKADI